MNDRGNAPDNDSRDVADLPVVERRVLPDVFVMNNQGDDWLENVPAFLDEIIAPGDPEYDEISAPNDSEDVEDSSESHSESSGPADNNDSTYSGDNTSESLSESSAPEDNASSIYSLNSSSSISSSVCLFLHCAPTMFKPSIAFLPTPMILSAFTICPTFQKLKIF